MDLEAFTVKLEKNYEKIKDLSVIGDVLYFINDYSADHDIPEDNLFIKRFVKVARHVFLGVKEGKINFSDYRAGSQNFSEEELDFVHQYAQLAISNLEESADKAELNMLCHLYSDQAKISELKSRMTDDPQSSLDLLLQAHDEHAASIANSQMDPKHAAFQYGRKGHVAEIISDKVGSVGDKVKWKNEAYESMHKCAVRTSEYSLEHSFYQFGFAAQCVSRLAERYSGAKKVEWLKKSHKDYDTSIGGLMKVDKKHCGYQLTFSAQVAEEISDLLGGVKEKKKWLKKAYDERTEARKILEEFGEEDSVTYQYGFRNKASLKLAQLERSVGSRNEWFDKALADISIAVKRLDDSGKFDWDLYMNFRRSLTRTLQERAASETDPSQRKEWLEKVYQSYIEHSTRTRIINQSHSGFQMTLAADAAKEIAGLLTFEPLEKIEWLHKAYQSDIKGAELVRPFNLEHYAVTYVEAGRSAEEAYRIIPSEEDLINAIEAYRTFKKTWETNQLELNDLHPLYSGISMNGLPQLEAILQQDPNIEDGKRRDRDTGKFRRPRFIRKNYRDRTKALKMR